MQIYTFLETYSDTYPLMHHSNITLIFPLSYRPYSLVKRAYPDKHSVWDKLTCPGSLTLKQFADWLKNDHGVLMSSWDFIYGHKTVTDDENKETKVSVSCPVYPPKPVLNYSLVPSLDLTMPQATQAIMKTPAAKPTQQYIALWKECKAAGSIPSAGAATVSSVCYRALYDSISFIASHLPGVAVFSFSNTKSYHFVDTGYNHRKYYSGGNLSYNGTYGRSS